MSFGVHASNIAFTRPLIKAKLNNLIKSGAGRCIIHLGHVTHYATEAGHAERPPVDPDLRKNGVMGSVGTEEED